jgi:hypothetical protein
MINLILTIIILALVIYMIIVKETFGYLDPTKCNYLPWGPDLKSCVNYCNKPGNDVKQISNNCNMEKCINICNECKHNDRCQWINPFVKDVIYNETNVEPTIILTEVTDENPSIYGTKSNSNEINIEWDDDTTHGETNTYMIHYVETTQMNNNIKIIYTDLNFFNLNIQNSGTDEENSDSTKQVFVDNDHILKNDTTYLFKVYGLHNDKQTQESNILTVST